MTLNADFVAATQLVVYVGGVIILMLLSLFNLIAAHDRGWPVFSIASPQILVAIVLIIFIVIAKMI